MKTKQKKSKAKAKKKKVSTAERTHRIVVLMTDDEVKILDRATAKVRAAYKARGEGTSFKRSDLIRRGALAEAYRQTEIEEGKNR